MGNALASSAVADSDKSAIRISLSEALVDADTLVAEHIEWALASYKAYN